MRHPRQVRALRRRQGHGLPAAVFLLTALVVVLGSAAPAAAEVGRVDVASSSLARQHASLSARSAHGAPRVARGPVVRRAAEPVGDWTHVFEVASYVTAQPPAVPLVLLIADSTAREATVSDVSWAAKVAKLSGPAVVSYTLGSTNQTYTHDLAVVEALPTGPALVFIGVGLSRFTNAQPVPATPDVGAVAALSPWVQHHYSGRHILSAVKKKALVRSWLKTRAPVFKRNYAANLTALDTLVQACQQKGMTPVLVELPLNLPIVRHAFDRQRARYRMGCAGIASTRQVPYLRFVGKIGLRSRDFYDLIHLVGPGRSKYQARLAAEVVTLLAPPAQP